MTYLRGSAAANLENFCKVTFRAESFGTEHQGIIGPLLSGFCKVASCGRKKKAEYIERNLLFESLLHFPSHPYPPLPKLMHYSRQKIWLRSDDLNACEPSRPVVYTASDVCVSSSFSSFFFFFFFAIIIFCVFSQEQFSHSSSPGSLMVWFVLYLPNPQLATVA